jgi:circadian clock protein KaiB
MEHFVFKLYIAGQTIRSEKAINAFRHLCEERLKDDYLLEIINILDTPERAEEDRILATPTLIRELPLPVRRIIGDLSDTNTVISVLNLDYRNQDGELNS